MAITEDDEIAQAIANTETRRCQIAKEYGPFTASVFDIPGDDDWFAPEPGYNNKGQPIPLDFN